MEVILGRWGPLEPLQIPSNVLFTEVLFEIKGGFMVNFKISIAYFLG